MPKDSRSHQKADAQREHMQALRGSRVLLVEDNDLNQELALELLGQAGIDVVVANHGQEALDILAHDAGFDGILMDCQMPVMDGYTAARRIHADPSLSHLPIVAMTANAMSGDREKVIDAGMLDHIPKPLDVESMFATLARYMVRRDSERDGASLAALPTPASPMAPATHGLPALPGIDLAAGLSVTMNNPSLYRRLLLRFREGQRDFLRQFDAARQGADLGAPERLAHTLRGTAGNIGALGVQAAAERLVVYRIKEPTSACRAMAEVMSLTFMVFMAIGVYSVNNLDLDIYMTILFGVLGYIFVKLKCEPAPLILAFVLGPLMEENLRRALLISRGDPMVFITRPISAAFLVATALLLTFMIVPSFRKKREEAVADSEAL